MADDKKLLEILELTGHFLYHRRGGKRRQYKILRILYDNGDISQKTLPDMFNIKSGSLSEVIVKMETDGLITRTKSQEDKRNYIIHLTEKGRKEYLDIDRQIKGQEKVLFDTLSDEEKDELYRLHDKLLADWREHFSPELFEHGKEKRNV